MRRPPATQLTATLALVVAAAGVGPASAATASAVAAQGPADVGARLGCPPLPPGTDVFQSTMLLVVEGNFGSGFVVRLSSAGEPDTTLQRAAQVGDTLDLELTQIRAAGFHPLLGDVELRERPDLPSTGQLTGITRDASCAFATGSAHVDVYPGLDVTVPLQETWITTGPVRLEAEIGALPPTGEVLEVGVPLDVDLVESVSGEARGKIRYARLEVEPGFPPAGLECFPGLFTADVDLLSPAISASLVGFGPAVLARDTPLAGGTCVAGGGPCSDDLDCPFLDTCERPRIPTELLELDVSGFDSQLGAWSIRVAPSGGDSDCCDAHPTPGCTDPQCEAIVCAIDPFCCSSDWDNLCAALAETEPACLRNCFIPGGVPSTGEIRSLQPEPTYPATATIDLFLEFSSAVTAPLSNIAPVPLAASPPITNVPAHADTRLTSAGPVSLRTMGGQVAGEISGVVHTLQAPADCLPPPAPAETCLAGQLRVELASPACPGETIWLDGQSRILRSAAVDPSGLGVETIDTVAARAAFTGTAPCAGPVLLQLSPAGTSSGQVSSLAADEFFPAAYRLDLDVRVTRGGTAGDAAASIGLETTVRALPPDPGEVLYGPTDPTDLLDPFGAPIGQVRLVEFRVLSTPECPADSRSTLRFPGPSTDSIDVTVPDGGGGVEYDVARGSLATLIATGGSFTSATCLALDGTGQLDDPTVPSPGDGFYYLARDGFEGFDGTWNSAGPGQHQDRDGAITVCD